MGHAGRPGWRHPAWVSQWETRSCGKVARAGRACSRTAKKGLVGRQGQAGVVTHLGMSPVASPLPSPVPSPPLCLPIASQNDAHLLLPLSFVRSLVRVEVAGERAGQGRKDAGPGDGEMRSIARVT